MLAHRVNFLGVGGGPKRKAAGGVGWGIDTRCASKFIECTRYDTQALRLLVDLGKQFMVSEQAQFLLANLDWAAAELGNQNLVAGLHAGGDALSVLIEGAGADGNDLCFVEILDGCLWEEDASGSLGFGLDALHKDAVEEGHNAADRLDGGHVGGLEGGDRSGGYHDWLRRLAVLGRRGIESLGKTRCL
jgi:hypothetical protein